MKRRFLFLLFLSAAGFLYSLEYFRSNPLGMYLERVEKTKTDKLKWYVVLETTEYGEKKALYHNGILNRVVTREKKGSLTIVREEEPPLLKKESFYNGAYLQKEIIHGEGNNSTTRINLWENNRLIGAEFYSNDMLVYKDTYITGENGVLLEARRVYTDGTVKISGFNYWKGTISSRWDSLAGENTVYRYTNGELTSVEYYNNSELVSVKTYRYDNNLRTISTSGSQGNIKTVKRYDAKNRLIYEESAGSEDSSIVEYTYSNNLLTEKVIKKPGFRELHTYVYDDNGKVETEIVFKNRILEKKIHYEGDGVHVETIFKDGYPFLRVFYKDGKITSREILTRGGE